MGGLASNIDNIARYLKDKNIPEKPMNDITHMGDIVDGMVSKSLSAFLNEDMNLVRELKKDDDKVDYLLDFALTDISTEYVPREGFNIVPYISAICCKVPRENC